MIRRAELRIEHGNSRNNTFPGGFGGWCMMFAGHYAWDTKRFPWPSSISILSNHICPLGTRVPVRSMLLQGLLPMWCISVGELWSSRYIYLICGLITSNKYRQKCRQMIKTDVSSHMNSCQLGTIIIKRSEQLCVRWRYLRASTL